MGPVFVTRRHWPHRPRIHPELAQRDTEILALVRAHPLQSCQQTAARLLAIRSTTDFRARDSEDSTFIQLVGVPHSSPRKAKQFREIDLVSVRESVAAATVARVKHFVYLSVAQPAPTMKEYIAVRAEGESMIRAAGLRSTVLRPIY